MPGAGGGSSWGGVGDGGDAELEPWHTYVPEEIDADRLDKTDRDEYIAAEDRILEALRREVTQRLPLEDREPINRYFEGSIIYPGRFARDWNRSYVLVLDAPAIGAVVLLHGLTDSPYSTRHIAERYRDRGYLWCFCHQ